MYLFFSFCCGNVGMDMDMGYAAFGRMMGFILYQDVRIR